MLGLSRRDITGVVALSAGLGALGGVVWFLLAPRVILDVYSGQTYPAEYQPSGFIADDVVAALLCAIAGVIVAAIVLVVCHQRRVSAAAPTVVAWALLSGVLGAVVLWWVGGQLGAVDLSAAISLAADGEQVTSGLQLRMTGVLVLWPLATSIVLAGFGFIDWGMSRSRRARQRSDDRMRQPV